MAGGAEPAAFDPLRPHDHPSVERAAIRRGGGSFQASEAVVCIPARDEAARIGACLDALGRNLDPADGIVLVVNGSSDDTATLAERILNARPNPWCLLDVAWRAGQGSAPQARRFAMDGAVRLAPAAHLLSLDADTVVLAGWRAAYGAEFTRGFDLVCGAIDFDPEEAALLPPADEAQEALVRDYRAISREIAALLDPDLDNPWPHHGNIGGANFGLASGVYARVGGLPVPDFGEERALRRRCEALGLRIRYSEAPRVWTSCRLDGRAGGGLSDELARTRREADPLIDEALEPASSLEIRLRARAAFRRAGDAEARRIALGPLGLPAPDIVEIVDMPRAGEAWHLAEASSPVLVRRRMRRSELARERSALVALLRRARGGA